MKRGFLDTVELIVKNYIMPRKIDIVTKLRTQTLELKQKVDKISRIFNNLSQRQTLQPVYRWGQNDTHVLINLKFAHRWGSPGCLDTWNKTMTVYDNERDFEHGFVSKNIDENNLDYYKQNRTFSFKAQGILGQMPLIFDLHFNLHQGVNGEDSYFKQESVGTIVIVLRKIKTLVWRYLGQK